MKFGASALWAVFALLPLGQWALADGPRWVSQPQTSELAFAAWYDGEKLPGRFNQFEARVTMDESGAGPGALTVQVELVSADMRDREINAELAEPDWFHVASFPLAEFRSDAIRPGKSGYLASGHLRLKGIEKALEIPLEWRRDGDRATLSGTVTLSRGQWQIGVGEWASDSRLEDRVELSYTVDLAPER
jgi:polyisoprenoid-binding protein YceI